MLAIMLQLLYLSRLPFPTNINGRSIADISNNNGRSMLRIGGRINRRLRRMRAARTIVGAVSDSATRMETVDCVDVMGDINAWTNMEASMQSISRGGDSVAMTTIETAKQGRLFQRKNS